ncbi:hypothetical protein FRB90_011900 [Tulasnella sp. 427]|nr:hypothetical protein FRB90_011900 [Tulasnella sp. 427]
MSFASSSRSLLRYAAVQRVAPKSSAGYLLPHASSILPSGQVNQARGFKFAPGEWIRNAIRQRTQTSKPEGALERQEARKEAVAKGEASLFDAVQEEMSSTAGGESAAVLAKAKKAHSEHRYRTASFKISPRKLNLLSRQVAGKPIDLAILQMEFSDKRAAGRIKSMLCTARDHALVKGIRRERMVVSESWVNKVDALPRVDIKGRSRTGIKHHRYSRMHVVLKEGLTKEEELAKKRKKLLKRALVSAGVVREDVPIRNPRPHWAWMSDTGDDVQVEEAPVEISADDAPKGKLSVEDALQQVLKNALLHDGLARGLRECAKALDKRQAHLCVLVETCTEAEYLKLIEALCAEHKINLIKVGDAKVLGTWAGLCKIDREGNPRKVVGCSCVVVKDYGVESEGLHVLLDYFKNR